MTNLGRVGASFRSGRPANGAGSVDESPRGLGGGLANGGGGRWYSGQRGNNALRSELAFLVHRSVDRYGGSKRYPREVNRHGRQDRAGRNGQRGYAVRNDVTFLYVCWAQRGCSLVRGVCGGSVGSFGRWV